MNIQELSVGDLVLIDGKPTKIDAVHQKKVGWHSRPDRLKWTRVGQVYPVDITPELLVRYGFIRSEDCDHYAEFVWCDEEDSYMAIVQFRFYKESVCGVNTLLRIERNFAGGVDKFHCCNMEHFHQLQQAIRLCKINKKIEV